jgi:hypothetical protein
MTTIPNPSETFVLEYTQFMRPDGRQVEKAFEGVPIELLAFWKTIQESGLRLEVEMLVSGEVNVTLTDKDAEEDYDGFVCPNSPQVPENITKMFRRFNADEHLQWRRDRLGDENA